MKIRLISLLLCLTMFLSLGLVGCSSKETDTDEVSSEISSEASESAVTLTMWVVSEAPISAETAALVGSKLNAITQANNNTKVVMKYLTADTYRETVEKTISAYISENGITGNEEYQDTDAATAEEMTELNEYGMSIITYPEAEKNQVDIVYITGKDMFDSFVDRNWLASLELELAAASGKIAEFTSANLLQGVKKDGTTYAVPNNHAVGEYTYLLFDKTIADAYSMNAFVETNRIDGFYNRNIDAYVKMLLSDSSIIPIANEVGGSEKNAYELCVELLADYWNVRNDGTLSDGFSVFGRTEGATPATVGDVGLTYENLFADDENVKNYLNLQEYKRSGCFKNATDGKTAAIRFVIGDSTVLDDYNAALPGLSAESYEGKSYYAVPIRVPSVTEEDLYSNMFGVCRYTKSLSRSMSVITLLNTDRTFRNLLQYGVEGVHYKKLSDNAIQLIDSDYKMSVSATGNEFIAYTTPDMKADVWEKGKAQNRDSSMDRFFGFSFSSMKAAGMTLDTDTMTYLRQIDEGLCKLLENAKTAEETEKLVSEIALLLSADRVHEKREFSALSGFIDSSVIKGDLAGLQAKLLIAYTSVATAETVASAETEETAETEE